jgi:hypothetical protein
MPNKHFYFALGAAHGALISYAVRKSRYWLSNKFRVVRKIYRIDRDWFLYFPFFIAFMGVIALLPDILHGLHILPKETTRSEVFNIFFFHSYFEWLEDVNPLADWLLNSIGSAVLLLLSMGILFFYIREVKRIITNSKKK